MGPLCSCDVIVILTPFHLCLQRADVWCCGVMLYAMLFQSFPFHRPEDRDLSKRDAMKNLIDVSRIDQSAYEPCFWNPPLLFRISYLMRFSEKFTYVPDREWIDSNS